jgi:uncharacterized protein YrzB (UPF0473 family)
MQVRRLHLTEYEHWIKKIHYAKRIPNIMFGYGLFIDKKLHGVCTFGMPPSSTLAQSIAGENYKNIVLELNRLVTSENLKKNTLSQFVSKSIKQLDKPKIIISFADPNNNHHGYIYQATNFIYTGISSNTTQLIDKFGNEFHFRNIGHYQKSNKLNVDLVKRRSNEKDLNRIEIANYLKMYKGDYTNKKLDEIFGYKDTAAHWFRTDAGFSFPKIDDWLKLKKILGFCDKYDSVMTSYELIPCPTQIIKKLELKKINIKGKHRYIYIHAHKKDKKNILKFFKYNKLDYPKGVNKNYKIQQEKQQAYLF